MVGVGGLDQVRCHQRTASRPGWARAESLQGGAGRVVMSEPKVGARTAGRALLTLTRVETDMPI